MSCLYVGCANVSGFCVVKFGASRDASPWRRVPSLNWCGGNPFGVQLDIRIAAFVAMPDRFDELGRPPPSYCGAFHVERALKQYAVKSFPACSAASGPSGIGIVGTRQPSGEWVAYQCDDPCQAVHSFLRTVPLAALLECSWKKGMLFAHAYERFVRIATAFDPLIGGCEEHDITAEEVSEVWAAE